MERFEEDLRTLNVDHRRKLLAHDVVLTRHPDHSVLSCCTRLSPAEEIVGIAMMLDVLKLDWPGKIFCFRFPLSDDPPALRRKHQEARRDYRLAWRHAAKRLIPDEKIAQLREEGCDLGDFCEREKVTPDLVIYRLSMFGLG